MIFSFESVFVREKLTGNRQIIQWWNKGRYSLNLIIAAIALFHFTLVVVVLEKGWIFFLLPIVAAVFISVNLFYSFGMLFELFISNFTNARMDFNRIAPQIKKWTFYISILATGILSIMNILDM